MMMMMMMNIYLKVIMKVMKRKYQILKMKMTRMNLFLKRKKPNQKRKRTSQPQIIHQIRKENQIKSKKLNKKF